MDDPDTLGAPLYVLLTKGESHAFCAYAIDVLGCETAILHW